MKANGDKGSLEITQTDFLVMNISYPIILGLPWFREARPIIDWQSNKITFNQKRTLMPMVPQEPALPKGVPREYQRFAELFRQADAVGLPEQRSYDLEIN